MNKKFYNKYLYKIPKINYFYIIIIEYLIFIIILIFNIYLKDIYYFRNLFI